MDKLPEELGDEERSYDTDDLVRSNVSGLIVEDDEVNSNQDLEDPEFLNSTVDGTVPILSISGTQGGTGITQGERKGKAEETEVRGRSGRGSQDSGTVDSQGNREGRSLTMKRSDFDVSALSGRRSTSLPPLRKQSGNTGHQTRLDGLFGQFREQSGGDVTQPLHAMTNREPDVNDLVAKQKKHEKDLLDPTRMLEKPSKPIEEEIVTEEPFTGGIDMQWESITPWGGQEELSPEEERQEELEKLAVEEYYLYEDLQKVLA
jgi:hypothetical protein